MDSDTPRTDSVWLDQKQNILEHARLLERELNEAKDHITTLEDEISQLREANLELTKTLNNIARK